jgi:acetyl esterase/lipase
MIIEHCTSSGKSLTIAMIINLILYKHPTFKILVLVPRLDLVEQMSEDYAAYGIDKNIIGILCFSAGGHLAASLATHYNDVKIDNPTKVSLRPDFQILIYPVISFGPEGHEGSRINLMGKANDEKTKKAIDYFSNEKQITKDTPPAFLVHSKDDDAVPVANSIHYYDNLIAHKVSAELYLFEKGGHGYGMKNPTSEIIWTSVMKTWMQKTNIIQ